jgi:uncharacterized protein YndB with AHSA1/START domain
MSTDHSSHTTIYTTPSDLELAMTRLFDAPRELVFDAWTNPEHLPHWMTGPTGWTMIVCDIDLRAGGGFRYVWKRDGVPDMEITGIYHEVIPPERLVFLESWGGDWADTINTLVLTEEHGKTRMTSTVRYQSTELRDAAMNSGMKEGMNLSFNRLSEYLGATK